MSSTGFDPLITFFAIGALILFGVLGRLIYQATKFNDTIILIGLGLIGGPVLHLVAPESLRPFSGIIGELALLLILFEGGLELDYKQFFSGINRAGSFALLMFLSTVIILTPIVYFLLGVGLLLSLVFATLTACTTALVVMSGVRFLNITKENRLLLGLESAITDVLVVVIGFLLISYVGQGVDLQVGAIIGAAVSVFIMAAFIGAIAGLVWLHVLPVVQEQPFGHMSTIGVLLLVFVGTESLLHDIGPGGGVLSALFFGLVLGNHNYLWRRVRRRVSHTFGENLHRFQGEISFLVRTFFFIYLGAIIDLGMLSSWVLWGQAFVLFLGLLLARYLIISLVERKLHFNQERLGLMVMFPRGLATAVLATVAAETGLPGTETFPALAFLLIIFTNLGTTFGSLYHSRKYPLTETFEGLSETLDMQGEKQDD